MPDCLAEIPSGCCEDCVKRKSTFRESTFPRTPVNMGKKEGRSPALWGLRPRYRTPSSVGASCSATLAYRVDHAAVCGDGVLGQRRIELAPASGLEVVAAVVV